MHSWHNDWVRQEREHLERLKGQQTMTTNTNLRAVLNDFDERLAALKARDDLLEGPKRRAIKELADEFAKTFDQTIANKEWQLRAEYKAAYAAANPVPPEDVVSSPYRQEIIERLKAGADAAEMYRDFSLRGHDQGIQVLRYYGPQHTRGSNNEKLVKLLNQDFPERQQAIERFKAAEQEMFKAQQATDLLIQAAQHRLSNIDDDQPAAAVSPQPSAEDVATWSGQQAAQNV